jgi:hypothetical protein
MLLLICVKEELKETEQRKDNEERLAKAKHKGRSDNYMQRVPYSHHPAFAGKLRSFRHLPQD